MKKRITAIFLVLFIFSLMASCTGNKKVNIAEYETYYKKSVENSMNADVYYYQETKIDGDNAKNREANVYAEKDDEGNILKNPDGSYKNHSIFASDKSIGLDYYVGISPSVDSKKDGMEYCLKRETLNEEAVSTSKKMTAVDFYNSEEFKSFKLDNILNELRFLDFNDMDFSIEDAEFKEKLRLKSISFAVKPEYCQNYFNENGKQSIFFNSKYVKIEMSYDRVAQIIVYTEEQKEDFKIDKETYNLKIAYYGPIIKIPSYDEKNNGELVWKEI